MSIDRMGGKSIINRRVFTESDNGEYCRRGNDFRTEFKELPKTPEVNSCPFSSTHPLEST